MLDVMCSTGISAMDNIRSLDWTELQLLVHSDDAVHNEILLMFPPSKMTDISADYTIDSISKEELLKVFEMFVAEAFHVFNNTRANSEDKDDDDNNNNTASKKIMMTENRTKRVSKSQINNKEKKMKTTEVVEEAADVEYEAFN